MLSYVYQITEEKMKMKIKEKITIKSIFYFFITLIPIIHFLKSFHIIYMEWTIEHSIIPTILLIIGLVGIVSYIAEKTSIKKLFSK